jgi:hypothetical protein
MSRKKLPIPDHGETVCCACGCSDYNSCERTVDDEIEICQWTWRDRKAHVGLCSFCSTIFPSRAVRTLAVRFRRILSDAAVLDGQAILIKKFAIDMVPHRR